MLPKLWLWSYASSQTTGEIYFHASLPSAASAALKHMCPGSWAEHSFQEKIVINLFFKNMYAVLRADRLRKLQCNSKKIEVWEFFSFRQWYSLCEHHSPDRRRLLNFYEWKKLNRIINTHYLSTSSRFLPTTFAPRFRSSVFIFERVHLLKEEPFSHIVYADVPEQWQIRPAWEINERLIGPLHAVPSAKILCPNIAHCYMSAFLHWRKF